MNIYDDKIALCFLSSDKERVNDQWDSIRGIWTYHDVEKWYRYKKNRGNYASFSQAVNEAIDDTDSEMMFFINHKAQLRGENDILDLIGKLSSGYCFAAHYNFGVFGFTKELIRKIGMLDESFIGGEYEDDDFALRINMINAAVWWKMDTRYYEQSISRSTGMRGVSSSVFYTKYRHDEENNIYYLSNRYRRPKRISVRHKEERPEISSTWMSKDKSYYEGHIGEKAVVPTVCDETMDETEKLVDFVCLISFSGENDMRVTFHCDDKNTYLGFNILKGIEEGRTSLMSRAIKANTWYGFNIGTLGDPDEKYKGPLEIRLFIQGRQIYTNTITKRRDLQLQFSLPMMVREIKNNETF